MFYIQNMRSKREELKAKEKEAIRNLIIATGHELIRKCGLKGLTMRSIAESIDYSQSKIYEFFHNKDELCEVICDELSNRLLDIVSAIPKDKNPEKYLTELLKKVMAFHADYPHSDELLTLVCYGPQHFKVPEAFYELEKYSREALKNLRSPYIKTEEEILAALDTLRCFKIGTASLMTAETSLEAKKRIHAMSENVIKVLIRGWK
jgi:AcrR family transcriptional regulator